MIRLLIAFLLLSCVCEAQTNRGAFWQLNRPNVIPSTLLTGLAAYYKLDESSGNALDSKGSHNGTVTGATQNVTGKINTCYTFNGSSNYVNCGAASTSGVFTFTAWIKMTAGSLSGILCGTDNNPGAPYIRIATDGKIDLLKSSTALLATSTGAITNGVFTHVAVSYDVSGNYVFYLNGSASGSGTSLVTFVFGNYVIGSARGFSEFFSGQIDEVGMWDRVLTSTEITTLYNSGTGRSYPF